MALPTTVLKACNPPERRFIVIGVIYHGLDSSRSSTPDCIFFTKAALGGDCGEARFHLSSFLTEPPSPRVGVYLSIGCIVHFIAHCFARLYSIDEALSQSLGSGEGPVDTEQLSAAIRGDDLQPTTMWNSFVLSIGGNIVSILFIGRASLCRLGSQHS